eukprot:Hpha_TRINITY_DN15390_c1_g8::TRINITY_DN15390_c1_g8_i1::g.92123::m.92123
MTAGDVGPRQSLRGAAASLGDFLGVRGRVPHFSDFQQAHTLQQPLLAPLIPVESAGSSRSRRPHISDWLGESPPDAPKVPPSPVSPPLSPPRAPAVLGPSRLGRAAICVASGAVQGTGFTREVRVHAHPPQFAVEMLRQDRVSSVLWGYWIALAVCVLLHTATITNPRYDCWVVCGGEVRKEADYCPASWDWSEGCSETNGSAQFPFSDLLTRDLFVTAQFFVDPNATLSATSELVRYSLCDSSGDCSSFPIGVPPLCREKSAGFCGASLHSDPIRVDAGSVALNFETPAGVRITTGISWERDAYAVTDAITRIVSIVSCSALALWHLWLHLKHPCSRPLALVISRWSAALPVGVVFYANPLRLPGVKEDLRASGHMRLLCILFGAAFTCVFAAAVRVSRPPAPSGAIARIGASVVGFVVVAAGAVLHLWVGLEGH